MLKIFTSFLLLISATVNGNSSSNALWIHFNSQNSGLENNTIYATETDKYGYVWFCGKDGIYQYNGQSILRIFNDEIPRDREFVNFFKDSKENLWLLGFEGSLFKINLEKSNIKEIIYNKEINKDNSNTLFYGFESDGNVHLFNNEMNMITIGKTYSSNYLGNPMLFYNAFLNKKSNRKILHFDSSIILNLIKTRIANEYLISKNMVYQPYDGIDLDCIFDAKDYGLVEQIIDVEVSGKDLLIALYGEKGGLLCVRNYNNVNEKIHKIDTLMVHPFLTGIRVDKYGNYWLSSYHDGIFLLPCIFAKSNIINSKENEKINFTYLTSDNKNILTTADNGIIYTIDENLKKLAHKQFGKISSNYCTIISDNGRVLNLSGKILLFTQKGSNNLIEYIFKDSIGPKKISVSNDNELTVISKKVVYKFKISEKKLERIYSSRKNITCAQSDHNDVLWIGNSTGLIMYKNGFSTHTLKGLRLNTILASNDSVWVSGPENIILLDKNGKELARYKYGSFEDRPFGNCKELKKNDDYLLAVFDNGIQILSHDLKKIFYQYHTNNHLYHFILYDAALLKNHLYITTDRGLVKIPLQYLRRQNVPSEIHINRYKTISSPTRNFGGDTLFKKYTSNEAITVFFDYLNGDRKNTKIVYSITESGKENNKWIALIGNEIIFDKPKPGFYLITIKAKEIIGSEWPTTARKWIIILPKWYQTYLFKTLTILILSGLFGWLILRLLNYKIKKERKLANQKEYLFEMESKAILNQLNPHFVFNALNPLQYYIATSQRKEGLDYLNKFAGMFRKMLKMSSQNTTTLNEEISFLKEYLFIQQTRYSNSFEYEIIVSEETNPEERIPSILIQPIVENAIEHGVLGIESGLIKIHISTLKSLIYIAVIDNGPMEFDPTKSFLKNGHALYIIQERLKIIGLKTNKKAGLFVERVNDETKITLVIPQNLLSS